MHKKLMDKIGWAAGVATLFLVLWGCAPVTVSSVPGQARVYDKASGKLIGSTPVGVNLLANDKEIIVRKEGYFSQTVALSPIDPADLTVLLRRRKEVVLLSTPSGAELFLAKPGQTEPVGRTPYVIDYSKGYSKLEIRAPGYQFQTVDIPADPEGNISVVLTRKSTVTVVSKPINAEIYDAEGYRLGRTPLDIPAVVDRKIELRKQGYYTKTVTVGPGTASPHMIDLKREPTIIVYSEPDSATVVHRGVLLGKTPYRHLVTKDMELELSADRFYTKRVTIAPDSPRMVRVKLEPKPFITVDSTPSGAKLYRSGGVELIGKTPVELMVENDIALEVHKPGYQAKAFTLSPKSNKKVFVPLVRSALAKEKTIHIDSSPSGALVYRPGGAELIGTTPLEQRVATERNFELQLDGFKTKIVTVAPDSANRIVFALARDESARNATISDPLLNTPSSF